MLGWMKTPLEGLRGSQWAHPHHNCWSWTCSTLPVRQIAWPTRSIAMRTWTSRRLGPGCLRILRMAYKDPCYLFHVYYIYIYIFFLWFIQGNMREYFGNNCDRVLSPRYGAHTFHFSTGKLYVHLFTSKLGQDAHFDDFGKGWVETTSILGGSSHDL